MLVLGAPRQSSKEVPLRGRECPVRLRGLRGLGWLAWPGGLGGWLTSKGLAGLHGTGVFVHQGTYGPV